MPKLESINKQSGPVKGGIGPSQELKALKNQIIEQQRMIDEVYRMAKSIKRYIMLGRILSIVYIIIVIAPIILAIIYLPPLLQNTFSPYKELLSNSQSQNLLEQVNNIQEGSGVDLESLINKYR